MEDNFNRNLDNISKAYSEFENQLKAATKIIDERTGEKEAEFEKAKTEELMKSIEELEKTSGDLTDELKDSIKSIKDLLSGINNLEQNIGKEKSKVSGSNFKDLEKTLGDFSKQFAKYQSNVQASSTIPIINAPGTTLSVGIENDDKIAKNISEAIGGSLKDLDVKVESKIKSDFEIKKEREFENLEKTFASLNSQISSYASILIGGPSLSQRLFAGTVNDVTDFRVEMREIAFQVEGINSSTRDLQNEFTSLGKNIVSETGKPLEETQRSYLKALKGGIESIDKSNKKQKDGLKVVKSGLALSTMIGSSSEQTADLFGDWYKTLGFSSHEMNVIARNSRDVARTTGITGDNLLDAMKASEGVLKNLRNQGNLTTTAANNIITAFAEAKKLGVEDAFGKIADAASSTNKLYFETDAKTRAFLLRSADAIGRHSEMTAGRFFQSRTNMIDLSNEMLTQVSEMTEGFGENQITSYEDFESKIANMTDDQVRQFSMSMEAINGMSIDEFRRLGLAAKKSGLGISSTIADLNKVLDSGTATAQERKKAQEDLDKALTSSGLGVLQRYSESEKSIGDYFANMSEGDQKAFEMDTQALAKEFKINTEGLDNSRILQEVAVASAQKLEDAAKASKSIKIDKDFSEELRSAMAAGDTLRVRELNEEMANIQTQLEIEGATNVDPMTELSKNLNELNKTIRTAFGSYLGSFIDTIGSTFLLFSMIISSALSSFAVAAFAAPKAVATFMSSGLSGLFRNHFAKVFTSGVSRLGGFFNGLARAFGPLAKVLSKGLGPLTLALGAIQGFRESEEAGRTKTEGTILGALTGGAKTGSFITGKYGDEAGVVDKSLGVAGAAAWGASAGLAITASLGGTDFGASIVIGAIIGAMSEIIKIITEGTDILQNIFKPIQVIVDYIYYTFQNVYEVIAGLLTLDFGRVFGAIFNQIGSSIALIPRLVMGVIESVFIGLPKLIFRSLSLLWEIPKMVMESILGGLASLAENEWVGPIFKTLYDAFKAVFDGFMAVWTPIAGIFSGIYNVFNELGKALFGASEGGGILSGIMWVLQKAIWGVSYLISWLLTPLILLAKALGFVLWIVGKLIEGIISPFQYLYKILVGNSIVPDLVMGIISWFAKLPKLIFDALLAVPKMIGNLFSNIGSYLTSFGNDTIIGSIFSQIGNLFNFIGSTLSNIANALSGIFDVFWGIVTLDFSRIWKGIMNIGSSIAAQFSNIGKFLLNSIKNSVSYIFNVLTSIPKIAYNMLKSVFVSFPKWLWGKIIDVMYLFGNFIIKIPNMIYNGLTSAVGKFGGWLYNTLMWPFNKIKDLFLWVGGKIKDAFVWIGETVMWIGSKFAEIFDFSAWGEWFSGIGDSIMSGIQNVGSYISTAITDSLYSVFVEFPTWLYNQFTSALSQVWDYIKSWIPGMETAENVSKGYNETAAEQKITMDKEGASTSHAVGGLVGAGADLLQGDFGEAGSKALLSIKEGASAMWENTKAVGSYLNPMNWFGGYKEGTKEILEPGLAMLHEGEMVIPQEYVGEIAKGNGDFSSNFAGSFAGSFAGGISSGVANNYDFVKNITKYASDAFGKLKSLVPTNITKYASDAFSKLKSLVPTNITKYASDAFGKLKSLVPTNITKYATDAFGKAKDLFSPMTKGFTRAMNSGQGIFSSLSRGITSQIKSFTKGKSLTEYASDAFGKLKDKLGGLLTRGKDKLGGLFTRGKDKVGSIYKNAKEKGSNLLGKSTNKINDNINNINNVGRKMKPMENVKKGLSNLAEGLRRMSDKKVFFGALNLIPTSLGLVAMIPGYVGVKLLEKIDGKKVESSLNGLSKGISKMANAKTLLGSATLLAVGISSLALIPAIPIFGLLGLMSPLISAGLTALGAGMNALGAAAANPMFWLGLLALGALNIVMIPLAYALSLLSPLLEAFGEVIKSAFAGISDIIHAVGESISMILSEVSFSKAAALFTVAGGLVALGAAMIGLAGGKFIAGWINMFSGDGIIDDIQRLSDAGPNLDITAKAVDQLSSSFGTFADVTGRGWFDSNVIIDEIEKLSKLSTPDLISTGMSMKMIGDGVAKIGEGTVKIKEGNIIGESKKLSTPDLLRSGMPMKMIGSGIAKIVEGIVNIKERNIIGESEILTNNMNDKIESGQVIGPQHYIPMVNPTDFESPASNVQPMHLRDVGQTILRDRVSSSGSKMQSDELSRMEDVNYSQLQELEQIKQGITELVALMKPTGNSSSSGNSEEPTTGGTKNLRLPRQSSKYGRIKYGKPSGHPNRDMINIGK